MARASVRAADRFLEAIAQRRFVAREPRQLHVADRSRRAEEPFGRDPRELGEDLVGEDRVRDRLTVVSEIDCALGPGEGLGERAGPGSVLLVLVEVERHDGRCAVRVIPWSERLEVPCGTGHAPGDGQLDGPRDRRLAGLVRSTDDRQARRQIDIELAVATQVPDTQPADPHSDTSCPARSRRPRRRTSRSSAASAACSGV